MLNSKRIFLTFLFFTFLHVSIVSQISAQPVEDSIPPAIQLGVELDFVSQYLWHGIEQSEGFVSQPWIWLSYENLMVSLWGNLPIEKSDSSDEIIDDFELLIDYEKTWNNLTFAPSMQWYFLPTDELTTELIFKVSYSLCDFSIFTSHTFDLFSYVNAIKDSQKFTGSYFGDIGVTYEKQIGENFTLNVTSTLGIGSPEFNSSNLDVNKWALNLFNINTYLSWDITEQFYIYPHIEFSTLLDKDLQNSNEISNSTIFIYGIAAGYTF